VIFGAGIILFEAAPFLGVELIGSVINSLLIIRPTKATWIFNVKEGLSPAIITISEFVVGSNPNRVRHFTLFDSGEFRLTQKPA